MIAAIVVSFAVAVLVIFAWVGAGLLQQGRKPAEIPPTKCQHDWLEVRNSAPHSDHELLAMLCSKCDATTGPEPRLQELKAMMADRERLMRLSPVVMIDGIKSYDLGNGTYWQPTPYADTEIAENDIRYR